MRWDAADRHLRPDHQRDQVDHRPSQPATRMLKSRVSTSPSDSRLMRQPSSTLPALAAEKLPR